MNLHTCPNPGCRCAGLSEYDGYCSPECATGQPSRIVPAACPCWHGPCVVGPFAPASQPPDDTRAHLLDYP
jgi:hypothetical protein